MRLCKKEGCDNLISEDKVYCEECLSKNNLYQNMVATLSDGEIIIASFPAKYFTKEDINGLTLKDFKITLPAELSDGQYFEETIKNDNECDLFVMGERNILGNCLGNGHYMCKECIKFDQEKWEEQIGEE